MAAPRAAAQPLHSPAAANELFVKARAEIKRGDYAGAYPLLRQSFDLDPTPGTLLNLAECEMNLGYLVEALEHFQSTAAALPASDERRSIATSRAASIDERLPHLLVHLKGAPASVTLLVQGTADPPSGMSVPATGLAAETPFAIRPGTYTVRLLEARAFRDQSVVVRNTNETFAVSFDLDAIEVEEARKRTDQATMVQANEALVAKARADAAMAQERALETMEAARRRTQEMMASAQTRSSEAGKPGLLIGIGMGFGLPALVGLGFGAIGGAQVLSDKTTVNHNCNGHNCTQAGIDAASDGQTWSAVSTIGFSVGTALLGTGLYFFVKTARNRTTAISAQPSRLGGSFLLTEEF